MLVSTKNFAVIQFLATKRPDRLGVARPHSGKQVLHVDAQFA